jgi:ADP-ribose pyrophosphatase YjhB (NUDIX family)
LDFIAYNYKSYSELDEEVKHFTKTDFSDLIESHARAIARYIKKDADIFLQAIKEKDATILHKYVPGIDPNFSHEMIFNLVNYSSSRLVLGVTTGLMAKSLQIGYNDPTQNPIVVQGMLTTSDDKIVFGVRSKPKFRSKLPDEPFDYKIMLCPAGYATFNADGNLQKPFYKELYEELGLDENDITDLVMFGQHKDTGFTEGTRIFFNALTHLSFDDIVRRWKKAPHGWEYADLIGIEFTEASISRLLTTKDFSAYSEKANGLVDPSIRPVLDKYPMSL